MAAVRSELRLHANTTVKREIVSMETLLLMSAAVLAGAAVGLASPAQAAPDVTGTYSKVPANNPSDNPPTTWTVTSCGADCVHVVSSLPAEYDLHLVNGQWTGPLQTEHTARCPDGSWVAGTLTITVDAAFTSGSTDNPSGGTCANGAKWTSTGPSTFKLTKQ